MIHFSTLPSGLYPAEQMQEEVINGLSEQDESFFHSLKKNLDAELRSPREEAVERIFEYSRKKNGPAS